MWIQLQGSWRPALEILILAVAIYYLFRFLRGTRGWPVVIGFVVLLLALALVTTILDLKVLRWLLGTFSAHLRRGRPNIDVIYGNAIVKVDELEIPHPRYRNAG